MAGPATFPTPWPRPSRRSLAGSLVADRAPAGGCFATVSSYRRCWLLGSFSLHLHHRDHRLERSLFTLLPDQFGSFMATFILPLAFLWLIVAYLDRGRELQPRERGAARASCRSLPIRPITPPARVNAITASLEGPGARADRCERCRGQADAEAADGFPARHREARQCYRRPRSRRRLSRRRRHRSGRQAEDRDRFRRRRQPQDRRRPAPPA